MAASPWPLIHAERKALIADLQRLTPEQWVTQSLCSEWTVRQVLGHMTSTAKITSPKFVAGLAGAGFKFHAMNAKNVASETVGTPADQLAAFSALSDATMHPPGPVESMLGEAVIHSEDIRRPLGISRAYPQEAVVRVAAFYQGSNVIVGAKSRIAGLRLRATDADWSTGAGPEVAGPVLSLVMAMTGRKAALDDLSGEGVATLGSRP